MPVRFICTGIYICIIMEYAIVTGLDYYEAKKIIFSNKAKIIQHKKFHGENAFKIDCDCISQCFTIVLQMIQKIASQTK